MLKNQITITEIKGAKAMEAQFPLLKILTPELTKEDYIMMLPEMIKNGYRMVGAFKDSECIGLSGFWINSKIWCGKYLEVDNFIVDEKYRSSGIGKMLLDWLMLEGKKHDCKASVLDSYVYNDKSHRFYFREGFVIKGFHFFRKI